MKDRAKMSRLPRKGFKRRIRIRVRVLVLAVLGAGLGATATGRAETYYVDRDSVGGPCSDQNAGTSESEPWCTIDHADGTVQAGDTVIIRGGEYDEDIWPEASGTADARITYRAYEGEEVILTGVDYAIDIRGQSYITIDGLRTRNTKRYVLLRDANHVWVQNCKFIEPEIARDGWYVGVVIHDNASHNWFHHNFIGGVGYSTADDDIGGTINVGSWENATDRSHYNLIEHNVLFYGGHHVMEVSSSYNVIRNNYFHNENWMDCDRPGGQCGNRNIGLSGNPDNVMRNVFERNVIAYTGLPPDNVTSSGISLRARYTIVRRNVIHHCDGIGVAMESYSTHETDPSHGRIYHNVFFHNGYHSLPGLDDDWMGSGLVLASHGGVDLDDIAIKNNIFHDNRTNALLFYYVDEQPHVTANNWEHAGDPLFVDIAGPADPARWDAFDFRLQAQSPCIDAGGFLTRAVGNGQGTVIPVENAGYFIDGFGIVDGDEIQFEGETERVRIVGVDYSANTLTVDSDVTWTDGQGVALPYEGSAPDIGAIEYGSSDAESTVGPNLDGHPGLNGSTGSSDSGCGCRTTRPHQAPLGLALVALLWTACAMRRRRRKTT